MLSPCWTNHANWNTEKQLTNVLDISVKVSILTNRDILAFIF